MSQADSKGASHTPGEWWNDKGTIRKANSEIAIAEVLHPDDEQDDSHPSWEEYHANAALIAAAPERLEALKALADDHEFGEVGSVRRDHLAAARAAIAKAEGR